jgi:hypothetical protein
MNHTQSQTKVCRDASQFWGIWNNASLAFRLSHASSSPFCYLLVMFHVLTSIRQRHWHWHPAAGLVGRDWYEEG